MYSPCLTRMIILLVFVATDDGIFCGSEVDEDAGVATGDCVDEPVVDDGDCGSLADEVAHVMAGDCVCDSSWLVSG